MNFWAQCAWKEMLAIGPIWLACCLGAAAAPLWSAFRLDPVALMAYVFGAGALGAHSIGHEYAHRTFGTLLAQPVPRTRILAVKLGVLAVALLTLTAVAWAGPYSPIRRFPLQATLDSRVLFLPTLMGFTLAPYLALVARSTLGGAVFTVGVPGLLLIASDLVGIQQFGVGAPGEIDRFKYSVFPIATIVACVAAALALWPAFARLEVPGDAGGHVSLPALGGAADRRSARNPYWLLAAKELRLQQMTFIVVALYVCAAGAGMWIERSAEAPTIPWWQLNLLYAALLSLLIGSLASAEERQLGTLEWQALLPLASWKQFAVKIAVVCGLTITAGIALPLLLAKFTPLPHMGSFPGFPPGALWMACLMTVAIAMGSLYVSTISSSGVRAVATALPVLSGAFILFQIVPFMLWQARRAGLLPGRVLSELAAASPIRAEGTLLVVTAGIVSIFVVQAFRNHAAIDRGTRRIGAQAAVLAGAIVAGGVAMFVLGFR